jgi:hypothetical protein
MAHRRSLHGTPGQVGFPGFPVEIFGFGRLRVVLFEENHIRDRRREQCSRKSGYAPPDFLLRLVALANFMRLSLRERRTRYRVQRSVAGNPGRDDKKERVVERERTVAKG